MTWTCGCGLEFKSWAAAERHARAEHAGTRITVNVATRNQTRRSA